MKPCDNIIIYATCIIFSSCLVDLLYFVRRVGGPVLDDLSPEERDARTVFVMQLSQRIRARDLEEFFSSVGKVRDVRMITCNKTRRFKGIAYIEFKDPESVSLVSRHTFVHKFCLHILVLIIWFIF